MDPFAQFPNEVLQEVFKHVASLPEKFKLAALNQKFRGAIMEMMKKPMDLKLNYEEKTVNEVEVPHNKWLMAVEVLAECTDFKEIRIHRSGRVNLTVEWTRVLAAAVKINSHMWPPGFLDGILDVLIKTDSLSQTTAFESDFGCGAMIEDFLRKCPKMARVFLASPVSRWPHHTVFNADLRLALGGKAITNLKLRIQEYPLAELSAFFKSLKPNILKQCFLKIHYPLDLVELIKGLSGSAWTALEKLHIGISKSNGAQLELLGLVTQLPQLRECDIVYESYGEHDAAITFAQFSDAVVSMFNDRSQQHRLDFFYSDPRCQVSGCNVINLFRRLQREHPELEFEHGEELGPSVLRLANLTFTCFGDVSNCPNDCPACRSFFPIVIDELDDVAHVTRRNGHLENYQLDRCMVEHVVDEINSLLSYRYKALSAEINEAQDQATVTFETANGRQFYITVACGRCFDDSCIECFVI